MLEVKFKKLHEKAVIPYYNYYSDSGFDLHSIENLTVKPGKITIVRTGLAIELPELKNSIFSLELEIRSRSGFAKNWGLFVVNSPGTIDFSYRGEIKILLTSLSLTTTIKVGDRVAQGVLSPVLTRNVKIVETDILDETKRGSDGFGSTGF